MERMSVPEWASLRVSKAPRGLYLPCRVWGGPLPYVPYAGGFHRMGRSGELKGLLSNGRVMLQTRGSQSEGRLFKN